MKRLMSCGALVLAILFSGTVVQNQRASKVQGVVLAAPSGGLSSSPQPLANARVEYKERGGADVQVTTTDAKGHFEFPSGRRGVVTASTSGLAAISVRWPSREGGAQLRIVLPPAAAVRGTLFDLVTKQAVMDGAVRLTVAHSANLVSDAALVENGRFEFKGLPPGPAVLVATADGFAPHFSTRTLEKGTVHDARIGLLDGSVHGSVLDASGTPVSGAGLLWPTILLSWLEKSS